MKPLDNTWQKYLQQGIAHMEGTTADGQRSFSTAAEIFEECAEQDDDHDVKAESRFRRAQVAHYEKQADVAREWINLGKLELFDVESPERRAQCRLIKGVVLEDEGRNL